MSSQYSTSGAQSQPRAAMAHAEQKAHETTQAARSAVSAQAASASEHTKQAASGVQQRSQATKEHSQGYLQTAREEISNVIAGAEQVAKKVLPESVAAYIPGEHPHKEGEHHRHHKEHHEWHPTELEQRMAQAKHEERAHKPHHGPVGGVGSLPGTPNEEGVAKLPEERAQEAKAAKKKGPVGGVGSLPGTPNEEGVAKLPEERAQEAAAAKVDQRLLAEQARQDKPTSGLRHEVKQGAESAAPSSSVAASDSPQDFPELRDTPQPQTPASSPLVQQGTRHVPTSQPEPISDISTKAAATTATAPAAAMATSTSADSSSDYRHDLSKPYPDTYHPAQLHPLPKQEGEEAAQETQGSETAATGGTTAGGTHPAAATQGADEKKGLFGKIKGEFSKLKGDDPNETKKQKF
ncbi:hypothetical protein AX16_003405 [Volvariella volvacea WC 439]|nr:hypothetical protein AX16_003405 [Volvariella volvacea WC 439]